MKLTGVRSWDKLAELTGYSRTTVKDLGTTRKKAEHKHVVNVASACKVPYEWFTIPSIQEAVEEHARRLESERLVQDGLAPTVEERREEDDDDDDEKNIDAPGG